MAAVLRPLQRVADEIVVAVDAGLGDEWLGLYESVADRLVRLEFGDFVEQSLEWVATLCSGDWIFRLDGDEVASPALISALPRLIEADDVRQYYIPCRWVHPDGRRWFYEWPWWPDFSNRLVRNDASLHFEGLAHSGAATDLPARYVEEPFYHLLCAVTPKLERERKVAYYAGLDRTLKAQDSDRLLRHFYLPEDYSALEPVPIPEDDVLQVEAWLRAGDGAERTRTEGIRLFERAEIDRFWAQRPLEESAYRATIDPLATHGWMRPGDHRPFRVRVRNQGTTRWPGGHDRDPLIRLSYRWRSRGGSLTLREGFRSPLPAPLEPGEMCVAPVIVAAPDEPGEYVLELDLIHERVRWFDCVAEMKMTVADERPVRGLRRRRRRRSGPTPAAAYLLPVATATSGSRPMSRDADACVTVVDRYRWMTAGRRTPLHVVARNQSTKPWPGTDRDRPIRLGYRWLYLSGGSDLGEGVRTEFPAPVEGGAEVTVPMCVEAPANPGRYVLEVDVVHEHVRWFECATQVEIDVRPPERATTLETSRAGPYWLASADVDFFDRVTRLCGLEHDEARLLLFQPGPQVDIPIPALAGAMVRLRPATSDLRVVDDTFWGRYHLPPPELGAPRVVVDLGSNIGLTMIDFAHLFPDALIAGVELDGENAALCRHNVSAWGDRCTVIEAAIWGDDGQVTYHRTPAEGWGHHIGNDEEGPPVTVEATTLDSMFESVVPNHTVDFLKIDIEGAEQAVFAAGGQWTERVRALKVETHEPYSVGACLSDLSRLGFVARPDERHWGAVVALGRDVISERDE